MRLWYVVCVFSLFIYVTMNKADRWQENHSAKPKSCKWEIKSETVQQMKEWLCESSEYLFLFIPRRALACIIGSYWAENGIPRKWPRVLSHHRKSYKSFNRVRTLKTLFVFVKKLEKNFTQGRSNWTYIHCKYR